jgi:REP element-mobilizing transposase RayT
MLPERTNPSENHILEYRNQGTILFCTACLKKRIPTLNTPESVRTILGAWSESQAWLVGRYVIMPDHIHFFCAPASDIPLLRWVAYWKKQATMHWPDPDATPEWQTRVWDTQMRNERQYEEKWIYIQQNPVRAGLVLTSSDWTYQGEINLLTMY